MPTPRYAVTVPSVVNYRLGPLDGSPCDTLGIDNDPRADFRFKKVDSLRVKFRDLSWHEPTAWLWDFGDGSPKLAAERFPVHDFPHFGKFNVCLTVSNQFGSDTFCREVDLSKTSGTGEAEAVRLNIWPNPADDLAFVSTPQAGQVELFDGLGRSILKKRTMKDSKCTIATGGLPTGVYLLTFTPLAGDGVLVEKLIVQH